MNLTQLIQQISDKSVITNLNIIDKLVAGMSIALISMGIVFVVLLTIAFIISLFPLRNELKKDKEKEVVQFKVDENKSKDSEDMEILVAIITAAICSTYDINPNNLVVRRIIKSNNTKTTWENSLNLDINKMW